MRALDASPIVTSADYIGWQPVNKEDLPYKGKYYPVEWEFRVKPASSADIRHFSSINEKDPYSVQKGGNDIIQSCVQIQDKSGENTRVIPSDRIFEHDRMFFVLMIHSVSRDATKSGFAVDYRCASCSESTEVRLTYDRLMFSEESEYADRYFDTDTRTLRFKNKNGEYIPFSFSPCTMRDADKIKAMAMDIHNGNDKTKYDTLFLRDYLPKVIGTAEKKTIKDIYMKYLQFNDDMTQLCVMLSNKVKWSQEMEYSATCTSCDAEGTNPMDNFRSDVLKSLFIDEDICSKLLG